MNLATSIDIFSGGAGSGRQKNLISDLAKKYSSKDWYKENATIHRQVDYEKGRKWRCACASCKCARQNGMTDIKAGGPGSGRTPYGKHAQQTPSPNLKRMTQEQRVEHFKDYLKHHTQTGVKPEAKTKAPATEYFPARMGTQVGRPGGWKHNERLGKITGPAGQKVDIERKNIPGAFYKKSMDEEAIHNETKRAEDTRQWKENLKDLSNTKREWVNPKLGTTKVLEVGALAKTTTPIRAFNNDKLEFKVYKPGTVVHVLDVLPKIGNNPQMILVKFQHNDIVHLPEHELTFHRTPESQKEKPAYEIRQELGLTGKIRPGRIAQETTTGTGAKYTVLKPVTQGRPAGSGNIAKGPAEWKSGQPDPDRHSLKGKFEVATGAHGQALKDVFTFDLNMKSFGVGNAKATVYDATYNRKDPNTPAAGTTVIVWRDASNKTGKVMEFNRDGNGYIKTGSAPAASFKNLGHLGGYLKQRYGISQRLPGESVAKKGKRK